MLLSDPWRSLPSNFPAGNSIFLALGRNSAILILGPNLSANKARNRPCSISRAERKTHWPKFFATFLKYTAHLQKRWRRRDVCDVTVCWKHNWRDVPEGIEVIELSKVIG